MRVPRRILVAALAATIVGCSAAGSTPAPSTTPGPFAPSTAIPPPGSFVLPTPVTPSTQPTPSLRPGWPTDSKVALDELMLAIGNPDTGSKSEAWLAFEAAITSRDAAAIATTAEAVLGHLEIARSKLAPYGKDEHNGVVATEWGAMMVGIAAGVTRMRDAATAGAMPEVEAGRTMMGEALQDHFYQGVYGPSADRWQVSWPWPDTRVVTPSRSRFGFEAGAAFDGNPHTYWTAGDALAPQWIEIDLGRTVTVTGIRLLTDQPVAGATSHRVTVAGPSLASRELATFTGRTSDEQWLEARAAKPIAGVRTVRVTTTRSPSRIGWREIEVVLAAGSRLVPCPAGGSNLALDRPVTASTSATGSKAASAVDGDRATRWEAGGPAPQSIALDLGRAASIGSVRLLPISPADAAIAVVVRAKDENGHEMTLGTINQTKTGSDWLVVTGPTPCVGLRWLTIDIGWGVSPLGWAEIEVLGTVGG